MTTYRKPYSYWHPKPAPTKAAGHSLSRGTEQEYWRRFKLASAVWATENGFESLDARQREACRAYFHTRALRDGVNKSLTLWTTADVDRVFAYLTAFAKGGSVAAALVDLNRVEEDGHRKRLLWKITQYHGHATVIEDYTRGRTRDPESVATADLENIARTCSNRLRAAGAAAGPGSRVPSPESAAADSAAAAADDVPFSNQF